LPWDFIGNAKRHLYPFGLHGWELLFTGLFVIALFAIEILQEVNHPITFSFRFHKGLQRWSAAILLLLTITFFGFYGDRTSVTLWEVIETEAFFEIDEVDETFIYERF
ncbi:MAG: hypothetical protein HOI15_17340, partial [Opitutales bacterium]|nr:hypothetical protein [Opitutales bacterium]